MISSFVLTVLIFFIALLYSSVGHAGGSGYLAAMALVGLPQNQMKPTALLLNILVALIGSYKFYRTGNFSLRLFLPFAIASVPFAVLGSALTVSNHVYRWLVGGLLLFSAYRLFIDARRNCAQSVRPISFPLAMGSGLMIGLLSGITGTGGGIFLSPLLLILRWASPQQSAAVSVVFILFNSIAGIFGNLRSLQNNTWGWIPWGISAVLGGYLGSSYGSRSSDVKIRRLLAFVLIVAGMKMILIH